ncbi:TRAP transporter substrate-binding protein [Pirellulales bacterium]|nr:TRAP transporter substrate-binding protein [Pirellulales bacterium]
MSIHYRETRFRDWSLRLRAALVAAVALALSGCNRPNLPEAPDGKQQPELVIRFATLSSSSHRAWKAVDLVRTELESRSQGRIKVVLYDGGVLGAERQLLENCFLGIVDMVQCTSAVVTSVDPAFSLMDLPYLFVDEQHHRRVLDGPIGQDLLDGLQRRQLQGLTFYSCGFRNIFNTQGVQIKTPADLAGMKIRVMESPVMVASLNALGASAAPLSAAEVFQSLKTKVVDGAENDPETFVSQKYYEAGCSNYSLTRHFANQHVLVVNRAWFVELKESHPDLHELIRDVPRSILDRYNRHWEEGVTAAIDKMQEVGVTVNDVDDVALFIDKAQPVYEAFFSRHPEVSRDWIARIRQERSL